MRCARLPWPTSALVLAVGFLSIGCGVDAEGPPPDIDVIARGLSSVNCTTHTDTGYTNDKPFAITVVTVDGKPVERATANAYYVMAQAASAAGVTLKVVSGFRTMAEQRYLYACYVNCNCNSCNLAAQPGYSNHQSGHALDLNTAAPGVYAWLANNGGRFGFKRTVPSEAWHWEWWSGGPGGGPCVPKPVAQAKADASAPDARPSDAGARDTGGVRDAGAMRADAGTRDATAAVVPDAGAGSTDSGEPEESAPPEGAPPEGGGPDHAESAGGCAMAGLRSHRSASLVVLLPVALAARRRARRCAR